MKPLKIVLICNYFSINNYSLSVVCTRRNISKQALFLKLPHFNDEQIKALSLELSILLTGLALTIWNTKELLTKEVFALGESSFVS